MSSGTGQFVWYDVMTTDPGAAADFYGRVIGWTVTDSGMPGQTYLLLSAGDTAIGGVGGALGPLVGSLVATAWSWRGFFAVNVGDQAW